MKWASAFSDIKDFKKNVADLVGQLKTELGEDPDIIFVFSSRMFIDYASILPDEFRGYFPEAQIAGCTGSVLLVDDREEAYSPGITVMGGLLPKVEIEIAHLDVSKRPGEDASPADWLEFTGLTRRKNQSFIVFADPFTPDVDKVLQGFDYAYNCPVTGGFSSGTQFQGEVSLFAGDKSAHSGMVLVSLSGNVDIVRLVAQGCRPIGDNLTITDCEDIVLTEVDGVSPVNYLHSLSPSLGDEDRLLLQNALFLGVEMDIMKPDLAAGDYLIRNIRGVSPENGGLVVGEKLQMDQIVRFHVRDPKSSRQELESLVTRMKTKLASRQCKGILLFSCLGRVEEFYGESAVDSRLIRSVQPETPLCGFFCSGEIGPIGGNTYLHGYTASAIYFYESGK